VLAGAVFFDAAVAQRNHARTAFGDVRIMGHDQDGRTEPPVQVANQLQDVGARMRIEIAGRLVREKHGGIHRESAGDGAALAFTAGQFVRQVVEAVREANRVQQLARAIVDLLLRPAAQMQRNGNILDRSEGRKEIEKLKNEADLIAAQTSELVVREAAEPRAVHFNLAGRRRIQAADEIQQRRLAGARGPDDGGHLAARNFEVDIVERRDLSFSLEDLADVSESNHLLAIMSYRDKPLHMRIGIDAGGTFTDFIVYHDDGRLETFKLRSNPRSPASVILAGIAQAAGKKNAEVIHGSTVATNALLERKGARTALITTEGFEDVIHIGRQNRAELYNLTPKPRVPIIPRSMCFGVRERAWFDGTIAQKPSRADVGRLRERLRRARVESIAICFLHAYHTPANEKMVADALEGLGYLCCSHDVCPEFREYERTSTTLINAYVGPLMDRYLAELERGSRRPIAIMQSNGGYMSTGEARRHAIRTVLSGPAGGVIGAVETGRVTGFSRMLGFDMGGTSTDVSLCDGAPRETMEASVDGFPVRVPMLDIHTVGAGGGSIARVDQGGLLRVGPESAGADPGPACYGVGDRPTVTDAHVVLGRIAADQLVGGAMHLDVARAEAAVERIAHELKISRVAAAAGIVRVANANMERAIRVVSVERGHDPRDFALIAFGGCGGLHACEMAAELGIRTVLVPEYAGALSALGMLIADHVRDYAAGVLNRPNLEREFQRLERQARKELRSAELVRSADIRYAGQSYELTVPWVPEDPGRPFHREHERIYGYSNPERPIEIVSARVRARRTVAKPRVVSRKKKGGSGKPGMRRIYSSGRWQDTPVFLRSQLSKAARKGPALVIDYGSTTLIPAGWRFALDRAGALRVTMA